MIKKYEEACREAGLSKEQIAEIDKCLDTSKKKLKRENDFMEKQGIKYFSLDALTESESGVGYCLEIIDESADVEAEIIGRMQIEELYNTMGKIFTAEESEFLITCFRECNVCLVARMFGMPRQTVAYRRDRMVEKLRKILLEEN